jgi:ribosomal subunit interface protein
MKMHIKTTGLGVTPSFQGYIEQKLGFLAKFVKRFDETGQAELWVEVARTTRHHHKGEVFMAEADLRLPKKILRAVERGDDVHAVVDAVKNTHRPLGRAAWPRGNFCFIFFDLKA